MSGRVIGVVVAQLDAMARMQTDRSVPQNVNFAIQSPIVINFLSRAVMGGGVLRFERDVAEALLDSMRLR